MAQVPPETPSYWLAGLAGVLAAPFWAGDYWLSQISFVLIYSVAGLGLMVLSGFTGLASIGVGGIVGVVAALLLASVVAGVVVAVVAASV